MIKYILQSSISLVCISIANFAVCYALSTPANAVAGLTSHENLSSKVAAEYLQTFAHEIIEDPQPLVTSVQVLSNYKIRETIFLKILGRSNQLGVYEKESPVILNTYSWRDLNLLYGTTSHPEQHLLARLNHTNTILGECLLAILLVSPTCDIPMLQKRQSILQAFLKDKSKLDGIKKQLQVYKHLEQSITSFWTSTEPLYTKEYTTYLASNFFFSNNKSAKRNKSVGALEFRKRIVKDLFNIQSCIIGPCLYGIASEIFDNNMSIKIPGSSVTKRELIWTSAIPFYGPYHLYRVNKKYPYPEYTYSMVVSCVGSLATVYGFYYAYSNYEEYASVLRNLALRMADIQTFIFTIDHINGIISASPELETKYGHHLVAIRKLLAEGKKNTELGQLLQYLQTLNFKNWSYFFNNAGKLLVCFQLFKEHKDAFIDAMYELGMLDAYCSFVDLIQEANVDNNAPGYVFASFEDRTQTPKPYLQIENMWNPFLAAKNAVTNSLTMDAMGLKNTNVILTGPNAGGKSTFLKGITYVVLLAHVMGIGPASEVVLTPFNKINTYIEIRDDISAGKSLFMTEAERSKEHIALVKGLADQEFSFTIFDEPFSGTNPTEGAAAEYSILNALADYTNSLTIVSTHYPLIMLLEDKSKHKGFRNYKVYITHKGEERKIHYTYKIIPGKSTQSIALDILQEEGFDNLLLAEAREIIEHPERYKTK